MPEPLGDRIQRLRRAKKLTQKELAELVTGTDREATVSAWETGKRVPRPDHFLKLADVLGVGPWYLWNLQGPESPEKSEIADLAYRLQRLVVEMAENPELEPDVKLRALGKSVGYLEDQSEDWSGPDSEGQRGR